MLVSIRRSAAEIVPQKTAEQVERFARGPQQRGVRWKDVNHAFPHMKVRHGA
jgi:hypothetical protein